MRVLFPYFSRLKGSLEQMNTATIKALHVISFITFGLISIFASCGNDLILFLYSDKWKDSIPIFHWLILTSFAYPISALLVNVIRGNGNSRLFLHIEIIKKVIVSIPFFFGWKFGIIAFVQSLLVAYILNVLINMYAVTTEIKLSFLLQVRIVLDYASGAVISFLLIRYLNNYTDSGYLWLNIIHQAASAISIFLLWNLVLKSRGLQYFIDLFRANLPRLKALL